MIRRLQIKVIAVVLGTLVFVFAAVLIILNFSMYQTSEKMSDEFMAGVVENDGFFLPPRKQPATRQGGERRDMTIPDMMRAGRFFYAKVDEVGEVVELNLEMMFDFSRDEALEYIRTILETDRKSGTIENFNYLAEKKYYGKILVFSERSIEISILEHLTKASIWAAGIAGLVLLVFSVFLAKWMVRPVKVAFDKQKRFISDASHELKTPLTIIGINADVLGNEIGENQRIAHIKAQSQRMSGLIHDLLTLAKADENASQVIKSEFSLSKAILETALEFECQAFEENKRYSYDIADGIKYTGDEKQIKQLVSILIDNAIRYSDEDGQVEISMRVNGNRPVISVYNTGIGVSSDEHDKIFERFFRSDESRSRESGGYGVGLSIAKAIVESHKGKIAVSGDYGKWVRFDITL